MLPSGTEVQNNTGDPVFQLRAQACPLDNHVISAAYFKACNNACLEAQSTGKGLGLCRL